MIGLLWDGLALGGLALIVWGAWMLYPPLAPVLAGVALLGLGIWGSRVWRSSNSSGREANDDR